MYLNLFSRNRSGLLKLEFHEVIAGVALVKISPNNRVVFYLGIWVLSLGFDMRKACFITSFEHEVLRNLKNLEWCVGSLIDDKMEGLEFLWILTLYHLLSVHTCPKIVMRLDHPGEICDEHVPVIFDLFRALTENCCKHLVLVDESRDGVRKDDAINLFR